MSSSFLSASQTTYTKIVDPRHAVTGDILPFPELVNKNLVPVSTLDAILDDDYFIRKLAECEAACDVVLGK